MKAISYAAGTASQPLIGQTIGDNLEATAARFPNGDALIVPFEGTRLTYGAFDEGVNEVARGLMAAGIRRGDRVGIWSPNNTAWVLIQFATAKVGAILVNINPAYRTHELQFVLNQSGCTMLIAATSFKTSDYVGMIGEIRPKVTALERTIFLGTADWVDFLAEAKRTTHAQLRDRMAALDIDDPINIQYTSGTTGFPKGATLTHHNLVNNAFFIGEACRYTHVDRVCIPVPLYHCFGMVLGNLACTTHAAAMVLPAPAFEPEATLRAVADERCTSLYGVPTMFIAELDHPKFSTFDLSTLRTGIMAGSPCPVEVMKRCIAEMHMAEVTIAYGMTETSPVSTQTGADDPIDKRVGTVGRVHPHVEVKIVDPQSSQIMPRGASGELCTRGYSVMARYWNEPERTAESIDASGWMHTGDLAVMDDDGYVNIVGRLKDMIIRGGENVYPREVEEFLYTHPSILDVQVIGVPDAKYGEEVMAWVRLRERTTLTRDELADFCRERIAHYKVPRYLHVTDQFPMTVTGKVQKYLMREAAIAMLGLEEAARIATA